SVCPGHSRQRTTSVSTIVSPQPRNADRLSGGLSGQKQEQKGLHESSRLLVDPIEEAINRIDPGRCSGVERHVVQADALGKDQVSSQLSRSAKLAYFPSSREVWQALVCQV